MNEITIKGKLRELRLVYIDEKLLTVHDSNDQTIRYCYCTLHHVHVHHKQVAYAAEYLVNAAVNPICFVLPYGHFCKIIINQKLIAK